MTSCIIIVICTLILVVPKKVTNFEALGNYVFGSGNAPSVHFQKSDFRKWSITFYSFRLKQSGKLHVVSHKLLRLT